MMEKVVTWAIAKAVEDVDDSVTTAALMGAALDTATFSAIGGPATGAVIAWGASGGRLKVGRTQTSGGGMSVVGEGRRGAGGGPTGGPVQLAEGRAGWFALNPLSGGTRNPCRR